MGNKRHLRTLPDGSLAITQLNCTDNAANEIELCRKTQFELGRQYLAEPSGVDAYRTVTEFGLSWRTLVHFEDWVRWDEPLPLDACHCLDVAELPSDRSKRDRWVLDKGMIVINEDDSEA